MPAVFWGGLELGGGVRAASDRNSSNDDSRRPFRSDFVGAIVLLLSDCTDVLCMGYLVQQEAKHVSRIARESQRFALKCQGTEPSDRQTAFQ